MLHTFHDLRFDPITNVAGNTKHRQHSTQSMGRLQSNTTGTRINGRSYRGCHAHVEALKSASLAAIFSQLGLHILPEQSALLYSLTGLLEQYQHADNHCNNHDDIMKLLTAFFFICNLDDVPYEFKYVCNATGQDCMVTLQKGGWLLAHPLLIHQGPASAAGSSGAPFGQLRYSPVMFAIIISGSPSSPYIMFHSHMHCVHPRLHAYGSFLGVGLPYHTQAASLLPISAFLH